MALDVTDEQPVTWFSRLDDDNTLSAALLDFFNSINEDGSLARIEEKYLGHGDDFDYVDTRSFLRAVDNVLPELEPLFKKYAKEIDWRLLAAISYQESHWDPLATSPTGVRGLMMLTKNTAQSLGLTDRTDAEQSISGGARYLEDMMAKVPETVPEDERIWFALAAYNMGYAHMLDARSLTVKTKGNPDSWTDVKQRLPLLSQKPYYSKLTYGYARGHEAYAYVENIRKYQISLVGYLQEKEKQEAEAMKLAQDYPAVSPEELNKAPSLPVVFIAVIRLPDAFAVFTVYAAEERRKIARWSYRMATRNVLSGIALYCRPRAFRTVGFLQSFNFLTTHTEKITEQRRTFIAQHPFNNLDPVIHSRMVQHVN
ncbi:hypothetical protein RB531_4306 [Salmonella enterica subsp. enterica serovar Typhimurium]